ncbi:hypothetical protein BDV95DRAFT_44169 [Massariosphaeria phaeospora]|uniref:Uncharacterized protein n=1 Tax=Massariosphaeria phaeospora TaxID=100035 RepID=A0A7C8I5W4_9PLEO|nr:hypothetical protein BDV95DRAFT_44169 [Massariosphaeria phaeospora]
MTRVERWVEGESHSLYAPSSIRKSRFYCFHSYLYVPYLSIRPALQGPSREVSVTMANTSRTNEVTKGVKLTERNVVEPAEYLGMGRWRATLLHGDFHEGRGRSLLDSPPSRLAVVVADGRPRIGDVLGAGTYSRPGRVASLESGGRSFLDNCGYRFPDNCLDNCRCRFPDNCLDNCGYRFPDNCLDNCRRSFLDSSSIRRLVAADRRPCPGPDADRCCRGPSGITGLEGHRGAGDDHCDGECQQGEHVLEWRLHGGGRVCWIGCWKGGREMDVGARRRE